MTAGESIGISTGGIAEIFETASDGKTECIILKSRGGVCKLALRHGVPIVPGYLFGNTQALTPHYDGYGVMQWLARKLKVPLCFFTGRFFLPIPHRTPLLCVFGDVIPVSKVDDPSPEQIQALLTTLQQKIKEVFDEHKATYGWPDVQLIIK